MDNINGLPDELLVKILTFVPTKVAVSTSILSKRWESLWKSVPKLEGKCDLFKPALRDFIHKNLPLRAPFIESLCLKFCPRSFQHEDNKLWTEIAVSRCLRELSIRYSFIYGQPGVLFPSSLYTCKSLVTLKLEDDIFMDVPQDVCLPSLKTLHLRYVTYSNQDSLRLLLSYCTVLEDLHIERGWNSDNLNAVVVAVPTLLRLSMKIAFKVTQDLFVIVTPSLRYFKLEDGRVDFSDLSIENMPELAEADINVWQHTETLLQSVTSVKRLTLPLLYSTVEKHKNIACFVFNQLGQVKIRICDDY